MIYLQETGIEKVLHIIWSYVVIAAGLSFVIGFAVRWWQSHTVSLGHFWIGGTAVISSGLLLLTYGLYPRFAPVFAPFALWFTGHWLHYNNWYYFRYPHIQAWLASTENVPAPPGMNTWFGRFLLRKDTPTLSWTNGELSAAGFAATCVFLLAYGFFDRINGIAESDRQNRAVIQKVDTVVSSATQKVVGAVYAATDTLTDLAMDAKTSAKTAAEVASKAAVEGKQGRKKLEQKLDRNFKNSQRVNTRGIQTPQPISGKRKVSSTGPADSLPVSYQQYYSQLADTLNYYP